MSDSRGHRKLAYTYSPGGLLQSVEVFHGNALENRTDYVYDAVGRLTGVWVPNYDFVGFVHEAGSACQPLSFTTCGISTAAIAASALLRELPALVKNSRNHHRVSFYSIHNCKWKPAQHELAMSRRTAFAQTRVCFEEQRLVDDFANDVGGGGRIVTRDECLDSKQVPRRAARPLKNAFFLTFGHARCAASLSPQPPAPW